jgi:type IV secretory pathway VirB4 component
MGLLDFIAPGKSTRNQQAHSTQAHLRIAEIYDDIVVLKNGGLRAVLKTSSINFNLKSEQEQNAIIYSYQNFLNSLEFPIQILIRSKKLDIDNYIDGVKALGDKQDNKLLQEQTFEYAQYVKRLVEYADIMEKEFYVIIPYDPVRAPQPGGTGVFQSFFQRLSPKETYGDTKMRHHEFDNLKKSLLQRVNTVQSNLENCGLKVEQLNTTELIELFYQSFNPLTSRTQKLKDLTETSVETDKEKLEEEKNREETPKEKVL